LLIDVLLWFVLMITWWYSYSPFIASNVG